MSDPLKSKALKALQQHLGDTVSVLQDQALVCCNELQRLQIKEISDAISDSRNNPNTVIPTSPLRQIEGICGTIEAINLLKNADFLYSNSPLPNDYKHDDRRDLLNALLDVTKSGQASYHATLGSSWKGHTGNDNPQDVSLHHLYNQHGDTLIALTKKVISQIPYAERIGYSRALDALLDEGLGLDL